MPNDLLTLNASVELTAAADGKSPPRVRIVGYTGGLMSVSGMGDVVIELSGLKLPPSIPILIDHRSELDGIAGKGTASIQAGSLVVDGTLSTTAPAGQRIVSLAKEGFDWQASVGVAVQKTERIAAGKTIAANGQTFVAPGRGLTLLTAGTLREISILSLGADPSTTVSVAASAKDKTMSTETQTDNADAIELDRQKRILAALDSYVAAHPAAAERMEAIAAAAIENPAMSADKTEVELLRASRSDRIIFKGPRPGSSASSAVLEASVCLTAGVGEKVLSDHYDERTLNAAMERANRGKSIHDVLFAVLRQANRPIDGFKVTDSTIEAAFEADRSLRASGYSTVSLSGILGNVASKSMLQSYAAVPVAWTSFCAVASNSDFKQATRYRMTGSGQFATVGAGGEIKHVSLSEQSYTNTLRTDGAMLTLTRQQIIDDDLGSFAAIPATLGRMSAIAVEKAVFTLLLSNPSSFFSSGNANYFEGAGTTLQTSQLGVAEQKFLDMTDPNGDPAMILPKVLLVPTALATTGRALITTVTPAVTAADATVPNVNPFAGKFELVVSPWLSNATLTGYSSTAWYLLTGPSDYSAMDVAFLGGKSMPTIENGQTDFNTLGMSWRAYLDFGVAMRDTRGAVMSKGAA